MATDDDKKVRQLLDGTSKADLERWFTLPSFEQVEQAAPASPSDAEVLEYEQRRAATIAAVDPALLSAIVARTDEAPPLARFIPTLDVGVADDIGVLDHAMIARATALGEPREIELGYDFEDEMRECTPQALLRDLHRAELYFEKQLEVVDAEPPFDAVAEVSRTMATSYRLMALSPPLAEGFSALAALRAQLARPWTESLSELPDRKVSE